MGPFPQSAEVKELIQENADKTNNILISKIRRIEDQQRKMNDTLLEIMAAVNTLRRTSSGPALMQT